MYGSSPIIILSSDSTDSLFDLSYLWCSQNDKIILQFSGYILSLGQPWLWPLEIWVLPTQVKLQDWTSTLGNSLALAHYLLCAAIWNLPVPGSFEIPALKSTSSSWALWCLLLGTCPCNNSYLFICPTPHSVSSGHSWRAEGSPLCPPSSLFLLICSGCLEVFLGA